jgi:hypothetical protein
MTILKRALLGSLRIALLGSIKAGLFTYTFFLTDTALASGGSENNDLLPLGARRNETAPPTSTEKNPMFPAANANWLEIELLGRSRP